MAFLFQGKLVSQKEKFYLVVSLLALHLLAVLFNFYINLLSKVII